MKYAYQCSTCTKLQDYDEYCQCLAGIDPRPNHREKGDAEMCRKNYEALETENQWHKKFAWEH